MTKPRRPSPKSARSESQAKADTDERLHPEALAEQIYTPEFLSLLGASFEFEPLNPELVKSLREIAAVYIRGRRMEDESKDEYESIHKPLRDIYGELLAGVNSFQEELASISKRVDIPSDLYRSARVLKEPKPLTDFPFLPDHQRKRGEPYYEELQRLLALLRHAATSQIERHTSKGGRPSNLGLKHAMDLIADFWSNDLGRPFTVDYVDGTGLTRAFDFCKALLGPLDDLADRQIVTAMRFAITEMRSEIKDLSAYKNLFQKSD